MFTISISTLLPKGWLFGLFVLKIKKEKQVNNYTFALPKLPLHMEAPSVVWRLLPALEE